LKIGLTLPSFVADPDVPLMVARAAEDAGLDGVFVYDHPFRRAPSGARRPALEGTTLLGAVAAETTRIGVGGLVFRATLRPPATLAAVLDTVRRVAGPRLLATLGSGDHESRDENETFGIGFGTMADRVAALRAAALATRDRGSPIWVGGTSGAVRALAADTADGWNRWGGDADRFAAEVAALRSRVRRDGFTFSWGGLFVLGADAAAAARKAEKLNPSPAAVVGGPRRVADVLLRYRDAGAGWAVVGPIDSSDPDNAALIGEARARID
jgi:alkanesulfonate monooxygenase SsuD/methylene tetrahydromethanopterin reductase-like flavin-dependent oxidoreductase (luciferase family)